MACYKIMELTFDGPSEEITKWTWIKRQRWTSKNDIKYPQWIGTRIQLIFNDVKVFFFHSHKTTKKNLKEKKNVWKFTPKLLSLNKTFLDIDFLVGTILL